MIRILYLVILTLPLCAFQCRGPQVETVMATVFGEEAARNAAPAAFLTIPDEPEVVALVTEPEVIVTPEPPPCVDYLWRGQWFDCRGNWLRDL
jgi:hypothetical protein